MCSMTMFWMIGEPSIYMSASKASKPGFRFFASIENVFIFRVVSASLDVTMLAFEIVRLLFAKCRYSQRVTTIRLSLVDASAGGGMTMTKVLAAGGELATDR